MPCIQPSRVEPLGAELLQEGEPGGDDAQRFGGKMGKNFRYWVYPFVAISLLASFTISLERIGSCNAHALRDKEPPYGGKLLPEKVRLVQRLNWFQFARYLDVYDAREGTHVGYFYDMLLPFWMRFGFSDASGQIWFEARYASFLSRFKFWVEYDLQRCDVALDGRAGYVWDVKENWWARPWPWQCIFNCAREFHVWRRPSGSEHPDYAVAPVARAVFNSTLQYGGMQVVRHEWFLNVTDSGTGSTMAWAQQHFVYGGQLTGMMLRSNWTMDVIEKKAPLPNWVIGFMAALDDIEEAS